jgi:hypothetical protein
MTTTDAQSFSRDISPGGRKGRGFNPAEKDGLHQVSCPALGPASKQPLTRLAEFTLTLSQRLQFERF